MKYTGIAVFVIGFGILAFCLFGAVTSSQPPEQAADVGRTKWDLTFGIIMGVVALIVGGCMYAFGGRGIIQTRNPAVRN